MFGFCSFAFVNQKTDEGITLLAAPEDKNVCIVNLNGEYFFTYVSDIRLINTNMIESIGMCMPDNPYFKKVKEKFPVLSEKIEAVFVIKTLEGARLPEKFVQKDDKTKKT